MVQFSFTDLHGFKDYGVFAQTYLPDRFPYREGVSSGEQWSLKLAFEGLYLGLEIAVKEKGNLSVFTDCRKLVDEGVRRIYVRPYAGRLLQAGGNAKAAEESPVSLTSRR